jgi:hypothetical protein
MLCMGTYGASCKSTTSVVKLVLSIPRNNICSKVENNMLELLLLTVGRYEI